MRHINAIDSKRLFKIVGVENGETFTIPMDVSINYLINHDFEWIYSILEDVDKLLNLNIGEKYSLRSNRDDEHSFMTVTRIN